MTDRSSTPLRDWLRENAPDCGDNSCLFGGRGKGGMRTNGGCRCFKDLPTAKRIYVERLYAELTVVPSETARLQMPSQGEILLACGELKSNELRAVKAALAWFIGMANG